MDARIIPGERYIIKGHPVDFEEKVFGRYIGEKDGRAYFQLPHRNFAVATPSAHLVRVGDVVQLNRNSSGVFYRGKSKKGFLTDLDRKNIAQLRSLEEVVQ